MSHTWNVVFFYNEMMNQGRNINLKNVIIDSILLYGKCRSMLRDCWEIGRKWDLSGIIYNDKEMWKMREHRKVNQLMIIIEFIIICYKNLLKVDIKKKEN
jgi:hypothetical protein